MKKNYSSGSWTRLADRKIPLTEGELYLFHRSVPDCPAEESLWGVIDRCVGRTVCLESSSTDLQRFRKWHPLAAEYRYCRLSTRAELRDYTAGLMWFECMTTSRAL